MSVQNIEKVNNSTTSDETQSLSGHELDDVDSTAIILSAPFRTHEVTRQFKVVTDPLTEQLEKLCDVMKELKRDSYRRGEETSGLT